MKFGDPIIAMQWAALAQEGHLKMANPHVAGMGVVTVEKDVLLKTVRENREQHRKIFLEAVDGFRKKAIELLEQRLSDAKAGRRINVYISLPTPVDQTREYDRVIRMLEMSVDNTVELTQSEFTMYVMDDWSWKKQFTSSNAMYSATAASQVDAYDPTESQ